MSCLCRCLVYNVVWVVKLLWKAKVIQKSFSQPAALKVGGWANAKRQAYFGKQTIYLQLWTVYSQAPCWCSWCRKWSGEHLTVLESRWWFLSASVALLTWRREVERDERWLLTLSGGGELGVGRGDVGSVCGWVKGCQAPAAKCGLEGYREVCGNEKPSVMVKCIQYTEHFEVLMQMNEFIAYFMILAVIVRCLWCLKGRSGLISLNILIWA